MPRGEGIEFIVLIYIFRAVLSEETWMRESLMAAKMKYIGLNYIKGKTGKVLYNSKWKRRDGESRYNNLAPKDTKAIYIASMFINWTL